MKTSCFYFYMGEGRVSIARFPPKHITGYKAYRTLAPSQAIFDTEFASYEEYRDRYRREILDRLDAKQVWDELNALTYPHEPVLLCHEHLLKPGDRCHRRIVAAWLEEKLGVNVPEAELPQHALRRAQLELF